MRKEEMHAKSRERTGELTTLIRRSTNLRIILRFLIGEARDRLGENPSGPLAKHLSLAKLLAASTPDRRASLRRCAAQHAPSDEGGTKTVQFWSRPGVGAQGEFAADDAESLVPTQEFARVLVCLTLVQHNRMVPAQRLREAIGLSTSSWSNIVTSLLPEEGVGDWPATLSWRGPTLENGGNPTRKPSHLGPPPGGLATLQPIFGDLLWTFIDPDGITQEADVLDVLGDL